MRKVSRREVGENIYDCISKMITVVGVYASYIESKYALTYHPMSSVDWNFSVILGMAVTNMDYLNVSRSRSGVEYWD